MSGFQRGGECSGPESAGLLERIAGLGPFFALEPAPRQRAGWSPITELVDDSTGALTAHAEGVRTKLAERAGLPTRGVEWRVAASVAHQGLAARVLAPALAAAIETGAALRCDPAELLWRRDDASPSQIRVAVTMPRLVADAGIAEGFRREVLEAFADPMVEAVHRLGVSRRVLRGNVASALAGAAGMIDRVANATAARDFVDALCRDRMLDGGYDGGTFRRSSCCLIYRVGATPAFCGDCVLTGAGPRSSRPSAGGPDSSPITPAG